MSTAKKKTAVIFDVDDTLYKELDYRSSGYRVVANHFAAACKMTPDRLCELMEQNPAEAFENIRDLAKANSIDIPVELQLLIYRTHRPDIQLSEETEDVLRYLCKQGYELGVITDGRVFGQLNKIAALGLDKYINPILTLATVLSGTDKHSQEPFEYMQSKFDDGTAMVYVGDNPAKDFHHPNLMGWKTIMLRDNSNRNVHHQRIEEFPADFRPQVIIDSITELKTIFK